MADTKADREPEPQAEERDDESAALPRARDPRRRAVAGATRTPRPRKLLLGALFLVVTPATVALLGTKFGAPWKPLDRRTMNTLPARLAQTTNAALEQRRLTLPQELVLLRNPSGRSDTADPAADASNAVVPLSPEGTRIRSRRPTLRWSTPGLEEPGSTDETGRRRNAFVYQAVVTDDAGREVASSPLLSRPSWQLGAELEPDTVYTWRVIVRGVDDDDEPLAPPQADSAESTSAARPQDRLSPSARFEVISAEALADLERRLERLPPEVTQRNEVARIVLLVEAGLLAEAQLELRRNQTIDSALRDELLRSLE